MNLERENLTEREWLLVELAILRCFKGQASYEDSRLVKRAYASDPRRYVTLSSEVRSAERARLSSF